MIRNIAAIFAGGVLAIVLIALLEMVGHMLHPPPAELVQKLRSKDAQERQAAMEALVRQAKPVDFLMVWVAWGLGTAAGCLLSGSLSKPGQEEVAWFVAGLMLLGGVATLAMMPHPAWMIWGVLVFPLGGWAGTCLARAMRAKPASVQNA